MIVHVVTFRWRAGVTPEEVEPIVALLGALPAQIPDLERYEFGPDLGLRDGNVDFAVVAHVADAAALSAYLEAPAHAEASGRLRALAAERSAVQFAVEA